MNYLKAVLVAKDDESRRRGLMFHKPSLQKDECALFKFDTPGQHIFWNKNVSFPISLLFCSASGKVEDIKYLNENQTKPVGPKSFNIKYVIEAHKDIPKNLKIKEGSEIRIIKHSLTGKYKIQISK